MNDISNEISNEISNVISYVVIYALFYIVLNVISYVPPRFLASGSAEIKDFEHGMASVKKIKPDGGKSEAMEGFSTQYDISNEISNALVMLSVMLMYFVIS